MESLSQFDLLEQNSYHLNFLFNSFKESSTIFLQSLNETAKRFLLLFFMS